MSPRVIVTIIRHLHGHGQAAAIAGSKWGQKRYLNTELLKGQELEKQIEVASA